jgi:hypothetical protein
MSDLCISNILLLDFCTLKGDSTSSFCCFGFGDDGGVNRPSPMQDTCPKRLLLLSPKIGFFRMRNPVLVEPSFIFFTEIVDIVDHHANDQIIMLKPILHAYLLSICIHTDY